MAFAQGNTGIKLALGLNIAVFPELLNLLEFALFYTFKQISPQTYLTLQCHPWLVFRQKFLPSIRAHGSNKLNIN